MTRDRLKGSGMNLVQAENIVNHVIRERERWGKLFDGRTLNIDDVLDALVFLFQHDSQRVIDLKESLAQSQKQLGASKAREARLNKINAQLRGEETGEETDDD